MGTMPDEQALLAANVPAAFWRLLHEAPSASAWEMAAQGVRCCLAGLPGAIQAADLPSMAAAILGEGQFGPCHGQLSRPRRLYYALRPCLPRAARALVQRLAARGRKGGDLLGWPIEDRYVRFLYGTMRSLLEDLGLTSLPYIGFWPDGYRYALVLTHDVETQRGQRFVRQVAEVEEGLGFRSSFNLVPEGYPVDLDLVAELRERGFEVGVHGLKHDGKLFSSHRGFQERAQRINGYVKAWQAAGFRSPMTHRNAFWMQALEVEYDSSFFDTDPFEPMPGGTMSIWPFTMGRFVELPYTLAQDHTLMRTLGETTPCLWLEKVAFIREWCGMALANTHPDYLLDSRYLAIYEEFLTRMREEGGCWHALPVEVARWWRQRASAVGVWDGGRWIVPGLPRASIGRLRRGTDDGTGALVLEHENVQTIEPRTIPSTNAATV